VRNNNICNLTVILCTYNRCESLSLALASVALSVIPESVKWEVLVVDNNSNDQTRDVVRDFSNRYESRFRYLHEARQGKSYALNTGIREARGDVLAFMDDDVTVGPSWLRTLTAPLEGKDWAGVGGRILPAEDFVPPRWLAIKGPYSTVGMLALFDLGDSSCDLHEAPFGTNMAFRKSMFVKHGGFRTDMGPCPGSEMRNEDTEFGRRLLAAGESLLYEPSAIVYHGIPKRRLTKSYFLTFWFDTGRASIREMEQRPDILGIPRQYLTLIKIGTLLVRSSARWALTADSLRRFYYKGLVWMNTGQIVEIFRQSFASWERRRAVAPAIDLKSRE
jgi:glycosyltransferase involved in cell wall biosynthesis